MVAAMVLTITRVEGDRIFGSVESWGAGGGSWGGLHHTRTFQGTLRGNELTFGPFQLTVDGRRMTGRRTFGEQYAAVTLTKR